LASLSAEELKKLLNAPQFEAVTAPDVPLLIFAGAGSGKTRALTYRIAYLIDSGRAASQEILAVTFTNKAAREMRGRIDQLLGPGRAPSWMGTFHSICGRILRQDGHLIGIEKNYTIYDQADRLAVIKKIHQRFGLDDKLFPPREIAAKISAAKNELIGPEAYAANAQSKDSFIKMIAEMYPAAEKIMRESNALDFDDMLMLTAKLLSESPECLEKWQKRFSHILVDEYQDTNRAQYVIVHLLSQHHRNLCVVGDDDQSIYRFRGADVRNIQDFERDYPEAKIVKLEQNYRSSKNILEAANAVIVSVTSRIEKKLWTDHEDGASVYLSNPYDEREEAMFIASEATKLSKREHYSLNDIAILYRTNAQSRALEEIFVRQGIPYKLVGGVKFYERREVKDALAYIRLVANPADTIAFQRVVNIPRRKIGNKTVEAILSAATSEHRSVWEILEKPSAIPGVSSAAANSLAGFKNLIDSLRSDLQTKNLDEVIADMLEFSGLKEMYTEDTEEAAERLQNLLEIQGVALEYAGTAGPEALDKFLEEASLVSDVDNYDETRPGITLITLHMVKGLEFPVVFMVGMEENILPHSRSLGDIEGLDDERRLCYVGITRAMKKLYLSHAEQRHLFGRAENNSRSRFLDEIPETLLEFAPGANSAHSHYYSTIGATHQASTPIGQKYKSGEKINHRSFGIGTVMKSTLTKSDEELVVNFDNFGVKIISARLAPIHHAAKT
jgi:DNA helicase-2/ATP-dependent DNA helicase PcrA